VTPSEFDAIEHRIERFIVILGGVMALAASLKWGIRGLLGGVLGAVLCWSNFRWLRHKTTGLINLGLAQAGAAVVHVPRTVHAKFFGRLLLLLVVVYVILTRLKLPAVPVICGLAAVVPAILLELAYELMSGHHRWNEQ
jgi:hypothetical protein